MPRASYLSQSRHGVFYFRWPLPDCEDDKRHTLRLSLNTRCPRQAQQTADYLAVQGQAIGKGKDVARIPRTTLRPLIKAYFKNRLASYARWLEHREPNGSLVATLQQELQQHRQLLNNDPSNPCGLEIEHFKRRAKLAEDDWRASAEVGTAELRKERVRILETLFDAMEHSTSPVLLLQSIATMAQDNAQSDNTHKQEATPQATPLNHTLGEAVQTFMAEYSIDRSAEMVNKVTKSLEIALEFLGAERPIADVDRPNIVELRKVLQAYPKARNTNPKTRGLSLQEALEVQGVDPISLKTANEHLQNMHLLWMWARQMGFVQDDLFEGMKFKIAKGAVKEKERQAFTLEHTQLILDTLLDYTSGRAANAQRDLDRKWGSLIGLFSGARRTEIAQLYVEDIRQDEGSGIWYIDFNDDGPDKSLKTTAAQRHVPLHHKLLDNGFLDFVETRRTASEKKLFPSFTYHQKDGCGKNLGRFFNESLLPSIGLKEQGFVFHCFRHTMVHRLVNAGVEKAICQAIVGHERDGIAEKYYNKGGYSLEICRAALDKFSV